MARIIDSTGDIAEGLAAITARDPVLLRVAELTGLPPLRRSEGGFAGLAAIVVSQQVSTASAAAILARCRAVFVPFTAATLAVASDGDFRAAGLSGPKIRTLRALAAAVQGGLDLEALAALGADEAHGRLTTVKGIGPWTADIYLMFCLGHADAFAAGDLALQEAARHAYGLPVRPDAEGLTVLAENWRPWRGVAARLLFAYYRIIKAGRDGAPLKTPAEPVKE